MGETTGISWSHATLNFWVGCTKVSTGEHGACEFCYAETWARRWPAYRNTWGVGATRVRFRDTRAKALKLERLAAASGAPFYCFSNSLSDIFDVGKKRSGRLLDGVLHDAMPALGNA